MDFDFRKGGENFGRYFGGLKNPGEDGVVASTVAESVFYHYEPGNATRYEVIFTAYKTKYGRKVIMSLVNFRKSMELSGPMGITSLGYMVEKLGINEGDCYALIPLINAYYGEQGQ